MAESLENMMPEIYGVVLSDYFPGIELVEEYQNLDKPDFEWNPKDNLIACIQFSPCLPFPERHFQEFIVERQADAFSKTVEIEVLEPIEEDIIELSEYQEERYENAKDLDIEANQGESYAEEDDEDNPQGLPSYLEEDWVKPMQIEGRPKENKLIRHIWNNGIHIERGQISEKYQVLVERNCDDRQIFVKCNSKSPEARIHFQSLITRLSSSLTSDIYIACTCVLCQKSGSHNAHKVNLTDLEKLKSRYMPEVQCYGSGRMMRLDEISTVEPPTYKVVIINSPEDDAFSDKAREHFFPPNSSIRPSITTRNQIASSDFESQYLHNVRNADVVLVLISLKLTGAEDEANKMARRMVEIAVKLFLEKKCLCLFVCINDPSNDWENISPFKEDEIPILNQVPIYDLDNTQFWKQIGNDLHRKIKNWLKYKADQIN